MNIQFNNVLNEYLEAKIYFNILINQHSNMVTKIRLISLLIKSLLIKS